MVFPDALILHTIRDPLDTLFSCFRCKFDDAGLEWSLDTSDLVLQYAKYLEIMQHFRTVLPGRVIDVRCVCKSIRSVWVLFAWLFSFVLVVKAELALSRTCMNMVVLVGLVLLSRSTVVLVDTRT